MSALVVGLDLLMKYCKKLKYIKNVIMITDGNGTVDWGQVDEIAQKINAESIKLSILCVLYQITILIIEELTLMMLISESKRSGNHQGKYHHN